MSKPKHKISRRAERVWTRLTEWYGARFAEQFGIYAPADWCEVVDKASEATVQRVLSEIRMKHTAHPPTFPEFEQLFERFGPKALNVPSMQASLREFALRRYGSRLTFNQTRQPWADLFERRADGSREIVGLRIPEDGPEHPAIRVMVEEMQQANAL